MIMSRPAGPGGHHNPRAGVPGQPQTLAAADEHGCRSRAAWYGGGSGGINSGLFLLDVAAARAVGLEQSLLKALEDRPRFGDQDAINLVLNHSPNSWFRELPCEFNFRPDFCYFDVDDCERCANAPRVLQATRGAYLPVLGAGSIYAPPFSHAFHTFSGLADALTEMKPHGGEGQQQMTTMRQSLPHLATLLAQNMLTTSSQSAQLNPGICLRRAGEIYAAVNASLTAL